MATAETVDLGEAHAPRHESLKVFEELKSELKHELIKLRHDHDKHEPEYFAAVRDLSDHDLAAAFAEENFKEVRVAVSAYGIHLFGKVRIPAMPADGPAYIQFRAFSAGPDEEAKFHAFHTEEKEEEGGGKSFRAIFTDRDPLEWFDN